MNQDCRLIMEALQTKQQRREQDNAPHGYPQGITAIQNTLINELKKRGFELTKIHHVDKERDKYPTVFMHRKAGAMHSVAEISGMGEINGEHYKDYLKNLGTEVIDYLRGMDRDDIRDEDAEDVSKNAFHYDPAHALMQAAVQINDILQGAYNDEATAEHIEQMALKILGPQSEYRDYNEFNAALKGVTALLNRYIAVPMN